MYKCFVVNIFVLFHKCQQRFGRDLPTFIDQAFPCWIGIQQTRDVQCCHTCKLECYGRPFIHFERSVNSSIDEINLKNVKLLDKVWRVNICKFKTLWCKYNNVKPTPRSLCKSNFLPFQLNSIIKFQVDCTSRAPPPFNKPSTLPVIDIELCNSKL